MEQNNYCLTLTHHGIKGMKWGVRRTAAQLGHKVFKKKQKPKTEDDSSSSTAPRKKSMSEMSDAELQSAIRRAQLEQQYASLHPQNVNKGKAFIGGVMNKGVIPAATEASRNLLRDKFTQLGKKYLGIDDIADESESAFKKLKRAAEESSAKRTIRENERQNKKWDEEDAKANAKAKSDQDSATKTETKTETKPKSEPKPKTETKQEATASKGESYVDKATSSSTLDKPASSITGTDAFVSNGRRFIDITEQINK